MSPVKEELIRLIEDQPGDSSREEILRELGFDAKDIDGLRASGAVPKPKERAA